MGQKRRNKLLKRKKKLKKKVEKAIKKTSEKLDVEEVQLVEWKKSILKKTSFSNGMELEDIVNRLCLRIGVPDLVISGPKFKDNKNNEKEVCDVLIPFDKTLIAFQVKHKTLDEDKEREVIVNRAEKLISKAQSQFATILKLISNNSLPKMRTLGGLDVELNVENFNEVIFITIVAYPGVEDFSDDKKFQVSNGFGLYQEKPLHIFDLDHFDKVSLEFDTLPDLLSYLEFRKEFYSEKTTGMTDELDFLGFYKMKGDEIREMFADSDKIHVDGSFWESYLNEFGQNIIKRNKKNYQSFIFDKLLLKAKESLGFDEYTLSINPSLRPGSKEAYLEVITELSKIPRLARRAISEGIFACLKRSDKKYNETGLGFAFRLIRYGDNGELGFVVLCVKDRFQGRDTRVNFLSNLCYSAYYYFDLESVIGLATESIECIQRSEDYMVVKGIYFEGEELDNIKKSSEEMWRGQSQNIHETEF